MSNDSLLLNLTASHIAPLMPAEVVDPQQTQGALAVGNGLQASSLHVEMLASQNEIEKHDALLENSAGIDLNAVDINGDNAWFLASRNGHANVVKTLIDTKVDVDAVDKNGDSALIAAVTNGHANVVKVLVDAKANLNTVDKNGDNAWFLAVKYGHANVVKVLVDAKANLNALDKNGDNAWFLAVRKGHANVVKILVDAKADLNAADKNGASALKLAAINGDADVVEILVDAKADLNAADKNGASALIVALENSRTNVVKILAEAGADVNVANRFGKMALRLAIAKGLSEAVKALMSAGAKLDHDHIKQADTFIYRCVQQLDVSALHCLTIAGLDLNSECCRLNGTSPFVRPIEVAASLTDPATRFKAINAVLKFGGALTEKVEKLVQDHYAGNFAHILADGHWNIFNALTAWNAKPDRGTPETRQQLHASAINALAARKYDANELLSILIKEHCGSMLWLPFTQGARLDYVATSAAPADDFVPENPLDWFGQQPQNLLELALATDMPADSLALLLDAARLQNPEHDASEPTVPVDASQAGVRPYSELMGIALAKAVYAKDRWLVKRIQSNGANPSAPLENELNAIQVATQMGDLQMFHLLNGS